jgi:hypothetical protein
MSKDLKIFNVRSDDTRFTHTCRGGKLFAVYTVSRSTRPFDVLTAILLNSSAHSLYKIWLPTPTATTLHDFADRPLCVMHRY